MEKLLSVYFLLSHSHILELNYIGFTCPKWALCYSLYPHLTHSSHVFYSPSLFTLLRTFFFSVLSCFVPSRSRGRLTRCWYISYNGVRGEQGQGLNGDILPFLVIREGKNRRGSPLSFREDRYWVKGSLEEDIYIHTSQFLELSSLRQKLLLGWGNV